MKTKMSNSIFFFQSHLTNLNLNPVSYPFTILPKQSLSNKINTQ